MDDRLKEYKKKVEQHNTTKDEFLQSIKTNMTEKLEDRNADSVWRYFQQQLSDGSVQFQEDGSASFMLPISFHLEQYLHPSLADAVDTVQFGGRRVYFQLPRRWRMKIERNIDSTHVTVALGTIIVGLVIILIVDCVQEARSKGDDDDGSSNDKAMEQDDQQADESVEKDLAPEKVAASDKKKAKAGKKADKGK